MTVQQLIEADLFTLQAQGDTTKPISKIFCCDLLSIAMSKAPADAAWVTVMGNRNTLAVASLADVSCIILAEGVCLSPEDLSCASEQGITVFATELSIFDAGSRLQEYLL